MGYVRNIIESKKKGLIFTFDKMIKSSESENITNLENHKIIGKHERNVNKLCLSKNEDFLYLGGCDNYIREWKFNLNNEESPFLHKHNNDVNILFLSQNDKKLYSGSKHKTIKIWKLKTKECIETL